MSKKIEGYLNKMCKQISNKDVRSSSYEEIKDHLLDKIEDLVNQGQTYTEAENYVLKMATNPRSLGKKLNLSHRPFILRYPLILFSTLSFGLSLTLLIIASNYLVEKHLKPVLHSKIEEEKFKKRFESDLILLSKYENITTRNNNGHNHIRKYVSFNSDSLPNDLIEINKEFPGWLHNIERMQLLGNSNILKQKNLNWISQLKEYDHWNYFSENKIKQSFQSASHKTSIDKIGVVASYEVPNLNSFRRYVVLHSIQLINKNKKQEAELIINHAIKLLKSTRTLIGYASATSLLKIRNRLIDNFKLNWQKHSKAYIRAVKRVPWGWTTVFSRSFSDINELNNWKAYMKPHLGMCAGVSEHPMGISGMSDFLYQKVWFESDHRKIIDQSKKITSSILLTCDLKELLPLLAEQKKYPRLLDRSFWKKFVVDDFDFPINPAAIPFVRRIAAVYLTNVAVPMYSGVYLREEDKK